jgi:hypothetical protein
MTMLIGVFALAAGTALFPFGLKAQSPVVLAEGTPVRLSLSYEVSSVGTKAGQPVRFEVVEDVLAQNYVIIKRGSIATGVVSSAHAAGPGAKPGNLAIKLDSVQMINASWLPVRAVSATNNGTVVMASTGGAINTPIKVGTSNLLTQSTPGHDVLFPKGTEVTAYIQGNAAFSPEKLVPKTGSSEPSVPAGPAGVSQPLTNPDIVAFKQAGWSDDAVILRIKASTCQFSLDPPDFATLKHAGISEAVLQAMINAQAKH